MLAVIVLALQIAPAAQADFAFAPGSVTVGAENADGTPDTLASSHPYDFTVHLKLKTDENGLTEGGEMRDLRIQFPPGLVGSPLVVPRCTRQSFEGEPRCPPASQIGMVRALLPSIGQVILPLYNLTPAPGTAAEFGFSEAGFYGFPAAELLSQDEGYPVRVSTSNLPLEATSVTITIWGVPADPRHNPERGPQGKGLKLPPGESEAAFFTLPASCGTSLAVTVSADSRLNLGNFVSATAEPSFGGHTVPLTGCGQVPFAPSIVATTTSHSASSPSGLDFELGLPLQGLAAPNSIAETEPEKVEVELPVGVTANPSTATGLTACSEEQFEAASVTDRGCPESSKLGTLFARSPLIEEPVEGSVYLATPLHNRFGSLLSLYIVAAAPERGVLIKQAGRVDIDQATGQLTTTFDGLPPVPYSSFELKLREGPRAPLTTPGACGTYQATARLYPFSEPNVATVRSAPFTINSGPEGGAGCVGSETQMPNAPTFEAGTQIPLAGAFSPFLFKVSREEGSQHLGSISATLPEGLLGKLAGVPYCSEAQIAAATARSGEGEGALEQSSPSCPQASQVGVVNIAVGAGSQPYAVQGNAYLAGPYKNAPLSLAIVTPALAGPFDLGTVVVRVALYINASTAQISAVSDPIPTILDGIPLDVRSVSLNMNRSGFTFNPTSCEAMSVGGEAISALGQTAVLSNRFQVGGCQGLAFKPSLTASTVGKASKANGASLSVRVAQKSGEADIHKVELTLPATLPARLTTLQKACTEAQFNANPAACPPGAFIGTATATTPVLGVPLTGPAILVSHGGAGFPDVEFVLQADERGSVIQIDLDGKTDIKKGVTYSRFETVPDAPITSFETSFPQGPHSIFAVNLPESAKYNLCGQKLTVPTAITGQNGARTTQATPIAVTGCSTVLSFTHKVKRKTLTLAVYAPAAGKVAAAGNGLTAQTKTAKGQENLTITLKEKKTGRLKTTVRVLFTPSTGKDRKKQAKSLKLRFAK
jgi:hypothetical protein